MGKLNIRTFDEWFITYYPNLGTSEKPSKYEEYLNWKKKLNTKDKTK